MVERQFLKRQYIPRARDITRTTTQQPQKPTYQSYKAPLKEYIPRHDNRIEEQSVDQYTPFERRILPDGIVEEITRNVYTAYSGRGNITSIKRVYVQKRVTIDTKTGQRTEQKYGVVSSGRKSKIKLESTKTFVGEQIISQREGSFDKSQALADLRRIKREVGQTKDSKKQHKLIDEYVRRSKQYRKEFNIPAKPVVFGTSRVTDIRMVGKVFEKLPPGYKVKYKDATGKTIVTDRIPIQPVASIRRQIYRMQKRQYEKYYDSKAELDAFIDAYADKVALGAYENLLAKRAAKTSKEMEILNLPKEIRTWAYFQTLMGANVREIPAGTSEELRMSLTQPVYVAEPKPLTRKTIKEYFFGAIAALSKFLGLPTKEKVKTIKEAVPESVKDITTKEGLKKRAALLGLVPIALKELGTHFIEGGKGILQKVVALGEVEAATSLRIYG